MNDIITAEMVKRELQDIAKQAFHLATGLKNVAPIEGDSASRSVEYLFAIAEYLKKTSIECEHVEKEKLLDVVCRVVEHDKQLRGQYQIKDKFRFVKERLEILLSHVEKNVAIHAQSQVEAKGGVAEDEVVVYVYLYNAQGLSLRSWQRMLNSAVFYEYSVNRPIYGERSHVEAFIRSRRDAAQHGYLSVAIKKEYIGKGEGKDVVGHPLLKIKEGVLHLEKLIAFTHQGHDYVLTDEGEFVKK